MIDRSYCLAKFYLLLMKLPHAVCQSVFTDAPYHLARHLSPSLIEVVLFISCSAAQL
jgi:hypothetical protein